MGVISAHNNSLFVQLSIVLITIKTITAHKSFQKPSKFIEESLSFITSFISNEQSSCEIMFLSASMNKPINQIDFSYISSVLGRKQYHAGLYYIDMHFGHKFKRFEDIHRMSVQGSCATVLVLLDHWEETVPQKLFNLITPPYTSITRKDEDHFIFLSPSKSVLERLLLSPKFGNKIKFKMGLDNDSFKRQTEVLVKTASLYDSRAGPKIISFPVVNQHSNKNKMFPDFTRNFRGFPLKLAIPKAPFRFELEMRADGRYHPKRGTYKPWLDTAMAKLNFTYDCFYSSYGGGTGIQFKNGSWVGAVADVRDNVADMAFFIAHIYNRHTVVDWSAPLSNEWIVFVSHKPQFYYSTYAILWPFKLTVWVCFLVSIICVTICLTMIASTIGKQSETKTVKNLWSTTKSLEYIFATFLEQDQDGPSKLLCNPIRVLCATWLWFALVTATAYRAKLVSVMAFPVASQVPRTYDQLVDSSYGVGMHVIGKGDAAHTVFKEGKGHVYEGIFARLQIVSSPLKCLLRAVHEDFGCLMWEGLNDYLNVKNITSRGTKKTPTQVSLSKTSFINDGLVRLKK